MYKTAFKSNRSRDILGEVVSYKRKSASHVEQTKSELIIFRKWFQFHRENRE